MHFDVISAFRRLHQEGRLTQVQYLQLKRHLVVDIADAVLCDTTPQVVQKAIAALETYPLRALDAIHMGAALVCAADAFCSADERRRAAARGLGLQVVAL